MYYQIAIAGLVFCTVMGFGGAVLAAQWGRRQALQARLRIGVLDEPGFGGASSPTPRVWFMGGIGRRVPGSKPTRSLEQDLARAGYHGASAAPIFIGAKFLLLALGLVASTALVWNMQLAFTTQLLVVAGSAAGLSFLPNVYVRMKRHKRQYEIRLFLPNAVDLLEVCVAAGMGLQTAWNCVTDEIRHVCPTLADEMALTNLETHLGASTAVAIKHMADRTGTQEIATLTAVLVQSERFGTSIGEALRVFANGLRETRSQRAQEAAEKMVVKMLFPMVLFLFPAAIVIMAGPAFLLLFDAMSS
ncbi:MAG: type II secretion system F family protein [Phycisphaeraceae bacterium]